MAGRGRNATLPAWMATGGDAAGGPPPPPAMLPPPLGMMPPPGMPALPPGFGGPFGAPPPMWAGGAAVPGGYGVPGAFSAPPVYNAAPPARARSRSRDRAGGGGDGGGGYVGGGGAVAVGGAPDLKSALQIALQSVGLGKDRVSTYNTGAGGGGAGSSAYAGQRAPTTGHGGGTTGGNAPRETRVFRRLYVGNIVAGVTPPEMVAFFNAQFLLPGDHLVGFNIVDGKPFGFAEFRTMEHAEAAMQLDGIVHRGKTLNVKRPNDFTDAAARRPPLGPLPRLVALPTPVVDFGAGGGAYGMGGGARPAATGVPDGPNKIFIGGLPPILTEADVRGLLE